MKVGKGGWEVPVEPPSIFGNLPMSCVPKHGAPKRAENSFTERNAIPDDLEKFEKADAVNTTDCVSAINTKFPTCVCYMTETELCVHSRKRCSSIHFFSLFISLSTMVSDCYSTFLKVKIPLPNHNVITTYSNLHATIHYLTNYTTEGPDLHTYIYICTYVCMYIGKGHDCCRSISCVNFILSSRFDRLGYVSALATSSNKRFDGHIRFLDNKCRHT
jgi:hypothetical protein